MATTAWGEATVVESHLRCATRSRAGSADPLVSAGDEIEGMTKVRSKAKAGSSHARRPPLPALDVAPDVSVYLRARDPEMKPLLR